MSSLRSHVCPILLLLLFVSFLAANDSLPQGRVDRELVAATVRLKLREGNTISYGSGTVVERVGNKVLVVTCAHVLESNGKGKLTVTVFSDHSEYDLTGQVLAVDDEADVALVSVDGIHDVAPIPLAPIDYKLRIAQKVTVAGCDHGGSPSGRVTDITTLNRFLGPPNVGVKATPKHGRSGGGLFTTDRQLIGVCNGFDTEDKEGSYAAVSSVHKLLARMKELPFRKSIARASTTKSVDNSVGVEGQHPVARSESRDTARSLTSDGKVPTEKTTETGVEIICIVRSKQTGKSSRKVFVFENASPEFLRALDNEKELHR